MSEGSITGNAHELSNRFDFAAEEARLLDFWDQGSYFHAEVDPARRPFSMVIPPPNVTGALHLGHALNNSLQDTMIRFRRMQGFNALWMPGTDHAGIATQAVVEKRLKEEEGKTRHDLGRDALVDRIWDWKDAYEKRILGQLRSMGASCDWERTRFTLDDTCAKAVFHTFFDLFGKALIYRGKKLVNWDTALGTAVSDDEVFSKTVNGHFWHLRYPVVDPLPGEPEFIIVATTRPETMLGDTAVAVHPDPMHALEKVEQELRDRLEKAPEKEKSGLQQQLQQLQERRETMSESLQQLTSMAAAGRKLMLPLMNREIPLVADAWAKPELGSGCVKITPAHDPNDYEVGKRCDLEMINILNPDGTLNAEVGSYAGLTIKEARKKVVADLEESGLLEKVEQREIEQPHSDRSKTPIEPYLANQWFVKMDSLAQSAMDAVADERVKIHPPRYTKMYLDWLGEKRDWPVSRQLWWGHQIPVWSKAAGNREELKAIHDQLFELGIGGETSGRASVQEEPSEEADDAKRELLQLPLATVHVCLKNPDDELVAPLEQAGFERDPDVLDTWFSSALWPHSTLGWPESTPELEYFYPTQLLITSRDIITLWVARMVLAGLNNVSKVPFSDVYIHPKILDAFGETMSKSRGNGIDPLDIIEKFGADSLRFAMVHLATETQDVRLVVQFECPHCQESFDQTKKNRIQPIVECPSCKKSFTTQWATPEQMEAHPRGSQISERFEVARNFVNKLWNAARFVLMGLEGYESGPIDMSQLSTEDRWLLSRMATVARDVEQALENYHFAEAARLLYQHAWEDFCSFYLEISKDRLQDPERKIQSQRLLAAALDTLLRMLHPIMPFVTEAIWQHLATVAPNRGLDAVFLDSQLEGQIPPTPAVESIMVAKWPDLPASWIDGTIEDQFAKFQSVLGAIREVRAKQQIPKAPLKFVLKCEPETEALLRPMATYFQSMVKAEMTEAGPSVESPFPNATLPLPGMEVLVDMEGHIDLEAEKKRLAKELETLEKAKKGKEAKLSNKNFVDKAPAELVEDVRSSLEEVKQQIATLQEALTRLEQTA